jgi:hypothetical protein
MSAAVSTSPNHNWRELYRAAILESDSTKVPHRIAEAEQEIVHRARELFPQPGDNIQEEQALDVAIRSLHLFQSTLRKVA